jgi:predicted NAD-dependent protein-ADP-ribosyltransferase YbiA (DUF1768 family)
MRIKQAGRYVTFTVESDSERGDLLEMAGDIAGQQFRVDTVNAETLVLRIAGPGKAEAAKQEAKQEAKQSQGKTPEQVESKPGQDAAQTPEPLNITFDEAPMPLRLISNLAETSFEMDGRFYSSVEGFWQGLKFPGEADRQRIAELSGHEAKKAGPKSEPGDRFVYDGREIVAGTVDHWALMERANLAKFEQDEDARAALLSTGSRPLVHRAPVDSRTIPGIVMGDIWIRLREKLARA